MVSAAGKFNLTAVICDRLIAFEHHRKRGLPEIPTTTRKRYVFNPPNIRLNQKLKGHG